MINEMEKEEATAPLRAVASPEPFAFPQTHCMNSIPQLTQTIQLHPHQSEALAAVDEAQKRGVSRQLVVIPTGGGKTITFAECARRKNVRTLIIAHTDELITQAIEKTRFVWPEADIGRVQAIVNDFDNQVVVASVQSAWRKKRLERLKEQDFQLLIVDEAHHAQAGTYKTLIQELGFMDDDPDKLLLGVTATPGRSDGQGLDNLFQEITYACDIGYMICEGFLSDVRGIRVETETDLQGVATRQGDFATGQLSAAVNTDERNQIIVDSYKEYANGRKAIAFCVDIAHSKELARQFNDAGISAAAMWGDMGDDERKRVLSAFERGEYQVLSNCNVLTEGFDSPSISCVLMARPTKSQSLYIQMVGRGLRTFPGKENCVVIDFTDSRHDVCQVATLAGKEMRTGESLREAIERGTHEEKEAANAKATAVFSKEFDLLRQSRLVWFEEPGGCFRMPVKPSEFIRVAPEAEGYQVLYVTREDKKKLTQSPVSLEAAKNWAEQQAKNGFNDKEAAWTKKPATEKQLELLKRNKIYIKSGLTMGEARELIEKINIEREFEPPTPKQVFFLRRVGRMEEGMTKREAQRIIGMLKQG